MKLSKLEVGMLGVNCYVLKKRGKAVVIDPGGDAADIINEIDDCELVAILATHSHYDHIAAVNELRAKYPQAEFICHEECDKRCQSARDNLSVLILGEPFVTDAPADRHLIGGDEISLAEINIRAFHVPGHAPGHLCYYLPDFGMLFSGDTVFAGGIGRSDFPGGDGELLKHGITRMLRSVPPETVVYSGHGPGTIAKKELSSNPFL